MIKYSKAYINSYIYC